MDYLLGKLGLGNVAMCRDYLLAVLGYRQCQDYLGYSANQTKTTGTRPGEWHETTVTNRNYAERVNTVQ